MKSRGSGGSGGKCPEKWRGAKGRRYGRVAGLLAKGGARPRQITQQKGTATRSRF